MKTAALSLLLLVSVSALGQETHKFWDAQNKLTFAVTAGIRIADILETCRNISNGGRERWLPTKSCGGSAVWISGGQATQLGFQSWMHRTGHHKMERWIPWISVAPNAIGIGYTFTHGFKLKQGYSQSTPLDGRPCTTTWNGNRLITTCP